MMHFTTFSDGFGYSKFSSIFQISTYLYGLYEISDLLFNFSPIIMKNAQKLGKMKKNLVQFEFNTHVGLGTRVHHYLQQISSCQVYYSFGIIWME